MLVHCQKVLELGLANVDARSKVLELGLQTICRWITKVLSRGNFREPRNSDFFRGQHSVWFLRSILAGFERIGSSCRTAGLARIGARSQVGVGSQKRLSAEILA